MAGILLLGAAPSGFNGGRSQVQSWNISTTGDFPFLNLMKAATAWKYGDNSGSPPPSELDANGYPNTIVHSGLKCITSIFPQSVRSGLYVLTWTGNGTMSLGVPNSGTITPSSGSLTTSSGSGRYEFTTTSPDALVVGITAIGTPTISNVQLFYKADETALNAGQIFGAQFLVILAQGKPGVIRFLDWAVANNTNVTTWATRKPVDYFSYVADEYRPSLSVGTTTSSGVKFAATLGSGAPVDKQTIHVTYNSSPISVSIANPAVVTWTSHGLLVGQPFKFLTPSGTALPAPIVASSTGDPNNQTTYWVTTVVNANSFRFSATKGGTEVNTTGGTLTGTPTAFASPATQNVTMSNANPAVVTWANHGLSIGDAVSINSTTSFGMPTPLYNQLVYYVLAAGFTTGAFQFSLTPGGTAISAAPFNITGCTSGTNQPVVTIPGHNFGGGFITFSGLGGLSGINGQTCAIIALNVGGDPDKVSVQIPSGSVSGTYTSGGTATPTIGGTIQAFGMPTLNLNGSGAIPIAGASGDPSSDAASPMPTAAGTLVYDAGLARWLAFGGNSGGNSGLGNCVPPEIMVALCTRVGAHPHFCAPFLACDPMTDWHTELATYVKNNGPSWMKPRFEGTNETWNPSGGFYATRYSWIKAPLHWGAYYNFDQHNWYGKIVSTIGQAVSAVYAGDTTKYSILCGVQTDQSGSTSCNPRLTSAAYVAQAASAQSGYTKTAAYTYATHVTCANYWSPGVRDTAEEVTLAADYAAAAGDAPAQAAIAAEYIGTANRHDPGDNSFNLFGLNVMCVNWKSWAAGFGVSGMCGYEGGYSPDYGGDTAINNLRRAGKSASNMQQYALQVYTDFAAAGGEFPSCYFISGGTSVVWGVWDPDIYVSTTPPQWAAIAAFNV